MKVIFIRFIGYEVSWDSLRNLIDSFQFIGYEVSWGSLCIIKREARFIKLRKLSQLTSYPIK
jgi:hypothetical protein